MNSSIKNILEIKNVCKAYSGVKALENVSLNIASSEVMALLGENGAGKSTLMKILSGAISMDSGSIKIDNKELPKNLNPIMSRTYGISIIYQELSLLPQLTVAENIYITHEPIKYKYFIDYKKINIMSKKHLDRLGVGHIDTNKKVEELSLAEQQMVEIAKSLALDCKVIIMDEPTTSLTWQETLHLFKIIRALKKEGITVIYISHRMDEIFNIADTATVMRDGKIVDKVNIADSDSNQIIKMMTGKLLEHKERANQNLFIDYSDSNVVFEVKNIRDNKKVSDVSFKCYKNEVLGLTGLLGSQRTEIAKMIFGADKMYGGSLHTINGNIVNNNPCQSIKNKIGYLSENRKEESLNLGMSIKENIVITDLSLVSNKGYINYNKVDNIFNKYKDAIKIKGSSDDLVSSLSGGNQQKVAIAKWLHAECDILIFDEPTRGIDVAAKSEIYKLIRNFASTKNAAIVISSDAAEIVDICDRVLIISNGNIVKEIFSKDINQENILKNILNKNMGVSHA